MLIKKQHIEKKKFKRNKKEMASIMKKYTPEMKFKFDDFKTMDIPNLMINIWGYSEGIKKKKECAVCEKYRHWCIRARHEKWLSTYIDINFIIYKLITMDKKWFDCSKVSSANSFFLYKVVINKQA